MTQPTGDDPLAALKPYVQIASGLMGISAAKAAEFAQGFLNSGGGSADEDRADEELMDEVLMDEVPGLSADQVRAIVREEVDRVARRMGFVREDELASMRRELDRLARQVADMSVEVADVAAAARVVDERPKTAKSKKTSGSKSKHKHKHDDVTHGEVGS
jgi:polyhydroxyalkanoate synthesis regulator phasin